MTTGAHFAQVPQHDGGNMFREVKEQINELFDSLVEKVNERREVLLRQLNQWEEEFNRTRASCIQSLDEMKKERTKIEELLATLKFNQTRTSMEKGIMDLSDEISEKENKLNYPQVRFICDKNDFDLKISKFGSLTKETVNVLVRNYSQLSEPKKVGVFGKETGEFTNPRGVAIDNDNQRVFIADRNSHIKVWSLEGVYLFEFGRGILQWPWEIVLCCSYIFISDYCQHFVSKWDFNTFNFVKKSNTLQGSAPGQMNAPTGLDVDNEEVFVVEYWNKRISVFDLDLEFKRIMAVNAIDQPNCLRVRLDTIYIIEGTGVIKLFSKNDQLLKIIPKHPKFSCKVCYLNFDSQMNFLITDWDQNSLFILSQEGDLIHSISCPHFSLFQPFGVDISRNGSIVMCFSSGSHAIAIF